MPFYSFGDAVLHLRGLLFFCFFVILCHWALTLHVAGCQNTMNNGVVIDNLTSAWGGDIVADAGS